MPNLTLFTAYDLTNALDLDIVLSVVRREREIVDKLEPHRALYDAMMTKLALGQIEAPEAWAALRKAMEDAE